MSDAVIVYSPNEYTVTQETTETTIQLSTIVGLSGTLIQFFSTENKTGAATFPGQALARHPSGAGVRAAIATATATAAIGLASEARDDGVAVNVQTFGRLTLTDWTSATGAAGLLPLADYYLDTTAGKLTTIVPLVGGTITQRVGRAISSQTLEIVLDLVVRN